MRLSQVVALSATLMVFGSAHSVSAQISPENQADSSPIIYETAPTEYGVVAQPFVIARTLHSRRKVRRPTAIKPAVKARKVRQLATSRSILKAQKAHRRAVILATHKEVPPKDQAVRKLTSSKAARKKAVTRERRAIHHAITKRAPNNRGFDRFMTSKTSPKSQKSAAKEASPKGQTLTPKQIAPETQGVQRGAVSEAAPDKAVPLSTATASREQAVSKEAPPEQQSHRVAIQVNQNDPAAMNLALNNAENVIEYYKGRGEDVQVEIVAFGPGLNMLRGDTSPVKDRIEQLKNRITSGLTFVACGNTQARMEKSEGKPITILPQATTVPSGVVRLMQLQEQGWSYIRP